PVANWTESNTTNLYNFSIQANESINITTINIPATFSLNDSTINSSGYHSWNCTNTSATTVKCNTSQNTTTSINIWFNATSPTITDETIYTWYINTTDLNNTENSTSITTGVDGKAPQIITTGTTLNPDLNATSSSYTFLTVNVSDTNINTVIINLSSLGLSNTTAMYDDGTNGDDINASDGIYSYNLSGSISYINGAKTLDLNLTDTLGNYNDTEYITLTVSDITKPAVTFTADQYSVDASGNDIIVFYAAVTDTELNNVTINLTELDGAGDQQMYNDCTHGDTNGSDTTWTFNMTVPETFNNGTFNVYVNATDNSSNYNDTQSRTITVEDVTGPYVTAMTAIPSTLPANGTILVLHANASDIEGIIQDGGNDIIYIDLSSIGGSSSQKMYDSGSGAHNDTGWNDGEFSIGNIIITDTIVSGTYNFYITATDINGNINSTEYIEINVTDVTIPNAYEVNLSKTEVNATDTDYTTIIANVSDLEL
ncbi:MAG: hypothetical protein KAR23_02685, partial [Candidatus Aenigmarchaeota archaeon]|nr:hypothetical protein [Candidatus Aenigmarchaeota archaeon]